ncbi:MAG: hypothetical protein JO061_18850 [Acidobacteriaceae bacterium]|nr:hypothetical protein [Acidobacteriaceae bacterium]
MALRQNTHGARGQNVPNDLGGLARNLSSDAQNARTSVNTSSVVQMSTDVA